MIDNIVATVISAPAESETNSLLNYQFTIGRSVTATFTEFAAFEYKIGLYRVTQSGSVLVDENTGLVGYGTSGNFTYTTFSNSGSFLTQGLSEGSYSIQLTVDSLDFVNETNENDNLASTSIMLSGVNDLDPPPDPGYHSDLDGNGADDLVFFNANTQTVGQMKMPDGSWAGIGSGGTGWTAVGIGQFDSDDTSADVLWVNSNTGSIGRFDLDGSASPKWNGIGQAGAGWSVAAIGDFNGDGLDDILWQNETTGGLGQMRVTNSGTQWIGIAPSGSDWKLVDAADFNEDGIDDLLWHESSTGKLGQFRMSADGSSWEAIATLGANWEVVGTSDFIGDDPEDILVYNSTTREVGYFDIWDGGNNVDWISLGSAGVGWSIVGTGDFDNSGASDILWRHTDGRLGQYVVNAPGEGYDWSSLGYAGQDWEVLL